MLISNPKSSGPRQRRNEKRLIYRRSRSQIRLAKLEPGPAVRSQHYLFQGFNSRENKVTKRPKDKSILKPIALEHFRRDRQLLSPGRRCDEQALEFFGAALSDRHLRANFVVCVHHQLVAGDAKPLHAL